ASRSRRAGPVMAPVTVTGAITGPARRVRLKLSQEAQVIGPELADVVDGVAQHGDALRAHAEGKAAELRRVVAAVAQHHRMYHAGAHDLQPARLLAQPAALAAADDAVHVHLDRRLGEREVAGANTHLAVLAEQ